MRTLNPFKHDSIIDRYIKIDALLNQSTVVTASLKKLQCWAAELQSQKPSRMPVNEKLHLVSQFVFNNLSFKISEVESSELENTALHAVVRRRVGSGLSLTLIYLYLAKKVGLKMKPLDIPGNFILKCWDGSKSHYIDLRKKGAVLSHMELLKLTQKNWTPFFEKWSLPEWNEYDYFNSYLEKIASHLQKTQNSEPLKKLLEFSAQWQPQNISWSLKKFYLKK